LNQNPPDLQSPTDSISQGTALAARNELYRFLRKKENLFLSEIPNKARSAFIAKTLEAAEMTDHELAVVTLVIFFDSVYLCAESNVCNRELLEQHLSDYAARLRCLYSDFIDRRSEDGYGATGPFGSGLAALANRSGNCPADTLH
jgi:hypothetical protein